MLISSDPNAVYARAKAADARIVFDIGDKPYGSRGVTCRDPERSPLEIGSYDPWQTI
jgi:uncharacterized glyoxalase superfamily protein PhnB